MNTIELFAVIFSLFSVWLTTKNNIWCWPTGIIGVIFYFFIFYTDKDWANSSLQTLFIIQSVYGWLKWNKKEKDIRLSDPILISINISLTMFLSFFFYILNTMFNGNLTTLDSITTSLSIVGMVLLANRKLESWFWWMVADVFYIMLFIQSSHYPSALVYFIFLILTIFGYKSWKNEYIRSSN